MTILILIATGAISAAILLFTFLRKRNKNYKPLSEKEISVRTESFTKLISDNYKPLDRTYRQVYVQAFKKWQSAYSKIFENAKLAQQKKLSWHMSNSEFSDFRGNYEYNACSSDGYELILENCFTDFFPSIHDMDDFSIKAILTELMVLKEINPEQSADYYVHEKMHFVNHNMMLGVIMFDLYRKKLVA